MSSANTCKFFLQGNCRFGVRCRFYHPRREQQGGGSSGHHAPSSYDSSSRSGRNRFSLFSDWNNGNDDGGGSYGGRGRGDPFQNQDQNGGQQDRYHYISPNYRSSHHRDQGEGWRDGGRRGGWEGGGGRGGRGGGRGKGEGWDGGEGGWKGRGRDKRGDIKRDNYRDSYSSSSLATDSHQDDGSGGNRGRRRGDQFQNQDQYGGQQDRYHTNPNYRSSHHRDQGEGWSGGGRDERGDTRSDNYRDSYSFSSSGSFSSSATGSHQDLATTIRKDMKEWKRSSMWPLSCYGNLHKVPYLPGLVDVSPEEMRFEAYMANSSGTSAEYLKNVAELLSQQTSLISKYTDLTLEDMEQLENLSPVSSGNGSSGLFGSRTKSGLFHSATATSAVTNTSINHSLFGEPQLSLSQTESKQTGTTLFTPSSIPQMNTLAPRNLFSSLASAMASSSPSSSQEAPLLSAATTGTNPNEDTSELTEEALMAFKADVFIFKQIPGCLPPPYLC